MSPPLDSTQFPEKVLQFGAGILLRGLPDYFIHRANQKNIFNGRIVVVKSTPGNADDFIKNGPAYLTCVRGVNQGKTIEENIENTSISRVITADGQWPDALKVASLESIQIIISNTTEVGIQFEPESIFSNPPRSFPAKLTSVLYERFRKLGDRSGALIVIPTELVQDNGKLLKEIVHRLLLHNQLEKEFTAWLDSKVIFCNSLVDRIVTKPSDAVKSNLKFNSLTIQAEPYKLWAIEGGEAVRKISSFASADEGVIIAEDITYYRERKIRLLNGTHTISVCLGFLKGFNTVFECMQDKDMHSFIEHVMLNEIEPTLTLGTQAENRKFAMDVLDRFCNPFTAHKLLNITLQATAKMKMRNIATLFRYTEKYHSTPDLMARGFAAYLLFMRSTHHDNGSYFGSRRGEPYPILDDQASYFYEIWKSVKTEEKSIVDFVMKVSQNISLWDKDLTQLPKFVDAVSGHLINLMRSVQL